MRRVKHFIGGIIGTAILLAALSPLHANELSPAGLWKTIDDSSGQVKGLVRIREANGRFDGKIEKIFPKPGEDPAPKCDKCDGPRKNQPVLGMTILWGLAKQTDDYQGGEILDPENGKVYRAKMKLIDGGKKHEVRNLYCPSPSVLRDLRGEANQDNSTSIPTLPREEPKY